jgi:hypothetical protein
MKTLSQLLTLLLFLGGHCHSALAGDSVYGTVVKIKSAIVVTLEYSDKFTYDVQLRGRVEPAEAAQSDRAKQFLSKYILGKKARMRFSHRSPKGQMLSKLETDDPTFGVRDVGLDLVRCGLVKREKDFDYKYGELSAAEKEAQNAPPWPAICAKITG